MTQMIEIDEQEDALLSLELAQAQLQEVMANALHWKWIVLALHNSLQGFMVLALQGTNGLNTLSEKSARRWMENYRTKNAQRTARRLDWFPNLYKKIKSDQMHMYSNSRKFEPKGAQEASVNWLMNMRDNFVHFIPAGWSLEVTEWPRKVFDILEIIEFLAFDSGNVWWHEIGSEDEARQLITAVKQQAAELHAYYLACAS